MSTQRLEGERKIQGPPSTPAPGALSGIRVVDFTWVLAGPQSTRILAEFGAEVIKIEDNIYMDLSRRSGYWRGQVKSPNRSPYFNNFNCNKHSITLFLSVPEGLEVLKRLIAVSDVVVENYSSRVMEKRGLDYEGLAKIRPDIIYISMAGLGHSGTWRDYRTFGPHVEGLSGMAYLSGYPDKPPAAWGYSYMDHTAGYYAATAILMALYHRNQTGQGQYIDLAQVEAAIPLTGTSILDYTVNGRVTMPPGNRSSYPPGAPHGIYPCHGEDRWIAISVFTDEEWDSFCRALEWPAWCKDPRFQDGVSRFQHQDDLDRHVEVWTRDRDAYEVMHLLQDHGVAAGVVQNAKDRYESDPQLWHRGFFVELDHPELGRCTFDGIPMKLSATPGTIHAASPLLGEYNDHVYRHLLGFSDEEVAALGEQGII